MAAVDDPKTLGRTRLSFANEAEVDEFVETLTKFEEGEIAPDVWRAYRLVRGTYGQRQPGDVQMLRVKIPQGILDGAQLHALAEVGERYSRGFGHITTRQNVQFHFIKLHDVEQAMRLLADVGLTTREACGNSVRNITACPYAGVAADELFDVTPYAEAMTRYLLRHPLSSTLPRKFKIAFEGCVDDHAVTAINDIGWRARVLQDGARTVRGFQVTIAGGTAILCRSAAVLYDFLPAGEMFDVAEAIVRVFHRLGDYQHKQRNRMKFLLKELGWERWRDEFERELAGVRAEGGAGLPFDPDDPPVEQAPAPRPALRVSLDTLDPDYLEWERTNVRPQRQTGFAIATASLPLGDLTSTQMQTVADLATTYGDGTVRVTHDQDLLFRWVPVRAVRDLYRKLKAAGIGLAGANTIADVTSCPGADSCRLAVTQSRGLGRLLEDGLRADTALASAAPDLRIKISGCPNGCGQHHIAGIGFQGSVKKVNHQAVPQYFVMVGGAVGEDGASFARLAAKVPARRIPDALARLIDLYQRERTQDETATAFFRRVELDRARACLVDLERLTAENATPEDFIDIGEDHSFTPEVLDGECSA